jgi:uncharacterized membrane protein YqjE
MMDSKTTINEKLLDGKPATHGSSKKDSSVLEDAQSLWQELRELSHDHIQLATLEAQLAVKGLVTMIVAGMMMVILLSFAWLGLIACIVLALYEYGVVTNSATLILLTVALNLLLALILLGVIRSKSQYLRFPATLRSLKPMQSEHRNMENK